MRLANVTSLALTGLVLISLTTCKKDNHVPSVESIIIDEKVKVIDNQTFNNNLLSLDSTNYTLTFTGNMLNSIKPDEIIVSSVGEGLLRKIKSVSTTTDGKVIVQTDPAYITDIIKQGVIEYNQPLTLGMVNKIEYYYDGIKLKSSNSKGIMQAPIEWEINTVLYDNDNNLSTTADQIRIEGALACDWKFATRIDVGWNVGLKEAKFGFESSETLDLKLIAGLQYNFEKKYTLATVNFSPIIITVGAVPVVFTPQLKITVGVNGYANASITTGINENLSFNAGMQYIKDKGWSPFKDFSKSFTFNPPQLNMNAGAEVYLKPELTVNVYGVAGPYANLKLYSKLDADLLQNPWWKLYGGLQMNAGVKVDILDKFLLEYTISDLLKYEELLAQSTNPPTYAPTVTTNTISSITATTATGGGNVANDGGATVTARGVCWSTTQNPTTANSKTSDGAGAGVFTSNITGLTENSTYYLRAYATNSAGTSYGGQVNFTTSTSATIPTITTATVSTITTTTAEVGGNVTSDGGATITDRGIYWGTNANPKVTGTKLQINSSTDTYSTILTGLTASTQYYVVAYAVNSLGEALGSELSFTTSSGGQTGSVTDVDGNTYNTVTIGTQIWMVENLKTTKYADGTAITNVSDNSEWTTQTEGAYCWYNNDINNKSTYGALYNFFTVVDSHKLCPTGWHVPTDADWTTLTNYLGGESVAGGKLKETGTTHWYSPNTAATNETGFTALPGGLRSGLYGSFSYIGGYGYWWIYNAGYTDGALDRSMRYDYGDFYKSFYHKQTGFSIRCVRD